MFSTRRAAYSRGKLHRALCEALEPRRLFSFGLTTTTNSYTVDVGANLVFSVNRTTAPGGSVGDLTSMLYNGTQLEAPFSATSRYSHYESGLSSSTIVTATVDPLGNWIMITCNDLAGVGVIQYYIAEKGFNNIYMATYAPGPDSPSPGEMRFITYTNHSVLVNAPAPSNLTGNTGAIESSDVFGFADGTTASKYYGETEIINDAYHGLTGGGFGIFMNMGNRESSSGGPFMKDIDFQTTSAQSTELYNYMFSGHSQTENFRPGLQGPYALQFTTGGAPAPIDYSFIDALGLSGDVPASGRGALTGIASGVPAGDSMTVALSNAAAQYWTIPNATTGAYTVSGVKPGTYTETLYQDELAVGTQTVTISAGATTTTGIVDTYYIPPEIFSIGTFDGTPNEFLNANLIQDMHPSDVRMTPWVDTTYTIGVSTPDEWPMAEWKDPALNPVNTIDFTLTAAQAATPLTLRIALTRTGVGGRTTISVNNGLYNSGTPAAPNEPDSRGITVGNWRGNNVMYTYNIPTSALKTGANALSISVNSGSSGSLYLSPWVSFDAIDLVTTASITNAPHVATITVSPPSAALDAYGTQTFSAVARDQFGNVIAANFTWTATRGVVDNGGNYTAPRLAGSDTVTASVGTVHGSGTVTVLTTAPNMAPTVATPASANPNPASGVTTSVLSVLGADDDGEANLKYTWSVVGTPPGSVGFSINGTNAAKTTTATFGALGTYTLLVTITDAFGLSTTSQTSIKVQGDNIARYQSDTISGTTLVDTSGSNNPAVLTTSFNYVAGVSGDALHLPGGTGGGFATLPTGIVSGLNDFTIAAWVKLDSVVNWERVFDFGTGQTDYMFLTMDAGTTNMPRFSITESGTGGEQQLNAPAAVAAGVWTHVAVTLAGNTATLYINGVAVATNTSMTIHPGALGITTNNYIGKSQFSDPNLAGTIDDFQIYAHALTAAQIMQLAVPAVVNGAAAAANPVTSISTALSVLGSDFTAGEPALTYTWAITGTPPAPVMFSVNGTNAAKNTTATFTAIGTYNFTVTITNPGNLSTTSSVQVVVNQGATTVTVPSPSTSVSNGQLKALTATVRDQFGQLITAPAVTWSLDAGSVGTVDANGNYTAPASGPGSATVRATSGTASGAGAIIVNFTTLLGLAGDDTFRLMRDAGDNTKLDIFFSTAPAAPPSTPTWSTSYAAITSLLSVSGLAGDDRLILDFTHGNPVPTTGLNFDGGTSTHADTLQLIGASASDAFTLGATQITRSGPPTAAITYANTEALDLATGTFTFNFPGNGMGLTLESGATAVVPAAASSVLRVLMQLASLTINPGGMFDLNNNDLIVANTPAANLYNAIVAGQLFSTSANISNGLTALGSLSGAMYLAMNNNAPFDNTTVQATDALVKYTYRGDAYLSGIISAIDFAALNAGSLLGAAPTWMNGDYNNDGHLDYRDYAAIEYAYANQQGQLAGNNVASTPLAASAAALNMTAATTATIAPNLTADTSTTPAAQNNSPAYSPQIGPPAPLDPSAAPQAPKLPIYLAPSAFAQAWLNDAIDPLVKMNDLQITVMHLDTDPDGN